MTRAQFFPVILIVLDLCAGIVCAMGHDWRKAVYWLAAAILTTTVTF